MTTPAPRPPIEYTYAFSFADGARKSFTVTLDPETLELRRLSATSPPDWTRLGFHQCPNCPLRTDEVERCPVAVNLVDIVDAFKDRKSFDPVEVTVESRNRTYTRRASLQSGVSALLGLCMVTSGCPVLDRLRPLVETHLPFMNRQETLYRILSLHLFAQFFALQEGRTADLDLADLRRRMEQIHDVNVAFCERLRAIESKDASVNAVVILSTLGDFPSQRMTQIDLQRLQRLVRDYYER